MSQQKAIITLAGISNLVVVAMVLGQQKDVTPH